MSKSFGGYVNKGGHNSGPSQVQTRPPAPAPIRTFDTGATRNLDNDKYDYEGFLSPLVIEAFARYMHKNRLQKDGTVRDGDNWQKGMPLDSYMKSGWRHFFDWWKQHRGLEAGESVEDALCALLFNVQGYLHEHLKKAEGPNAIILVEGSVTESELQMLREARRKVGLSK